MPRRPYPAKYSRPIIDEESLMKGLTSNVTGISIEEVVKRVPTDDVRITDSELLASWNWGNSTTLPRSGSKPSIIVPGSPPQWTERPFPFTVQRDTGLNFIDQSGYHFPDAPEIPLVAAIKYCRPDFDLGGVDILTTRNALRKLYRWVSGAGRKTNEAEYRDSSFRIDLQMAGEKTAVFRRWEVQRTEMGGFGYGHNFEKETTRQVPGIDGSHHRIITYNLNGLKILLGYEVDACLPPSSYHDQAEGKKSTEKESGARDVTLDSIAQQMGNLSLDKSEGEERQKGTNLLDEVITIIPKGRLVKSTDTIELTTRSAKNFAAFNWSDPYPQIFFSQTQHLFIAVHQMGRFETVHRYELGKGLLKTVAESECMENMKKLRALIGMIVEMVIKAAGQGKSLTIICRDDGLKLYERGDTTNLLPSNILSFFS